MKSVFPALWVTSRGASSHTHAATQDAFYLAKSGGRANTICGSKIGRFPQLLMTDGGDADARIHITCAHCLRQIDARAKRQREALECNNSA